MRIIILFFLCTLTFLSCKKKTATVEETNTSKSLPCAVLTVSYVYRDSFGVVRPIDSSAVAIFSKDSTFLNSSCVNVGTLKYNDTILPFDTYAYDSENKRVNVLGNYIWSSSGSSIFPAFTYTVTHPFPVYNGGNLLPDTILGLMD